MDRLPISDDEVSLFVPGFNTAPEVVNDNRIASDPAGQLPQSSKGRKPSSDPAGDLRMRDMERTVLDFIQRSGNPAEAIADFRRALASVGNQFGITKMSLDGDGADDLPVDDEEAERRNSGESKDATLDTIFQVLDGLEKTGTDTIKVDGKPTDSGRVLKEARSLVRIIATNLQGVRERKQRRTNVGDDAAANSADAYREASPAFSAMSLSRPQSDAEAERIVDQMFERKFYRPEAK